MGRTECAADPENRKLWQQKETLVALQGWTFQAGRGIEPLRGSRVPLLCWEGGRVRRQRPCLRLSGIGKAMGRRKKCAVNARRRHTAYP